MPAVSLVIFSCIIFSSNMDHDSHKIRASPRRRGVLLQPTACSFQDVRFEREISSKLVLDVTEILVGSKDGVNCYVTSGKVLEFSIVYSRTKCVYFQPLRERTL